MWRPNTIAPGFFPTPNETLAARSSSTVRVIGPAWASGPKGLAGNIGTRPWVGLKPTIPQKDAGMRMLPPASVPTATGPIAYAGQEAVARDTRALTAALAATGGGRGYLCALSPGSAARIGNAHYASETEWLHAWAGVLRQEYAAILDAGLELQIDDPSLAESWDQVNPEPSVADYQRFVARRIEALNLALEGLDTSRVRLHLCWGSWHGPHTTDVPLADILGEVLQANVGGLSFEAGNVRHEHEWTVWRDVEVPAGLTLLPGVVRAFGERHPHVRVNLADVDVNTVRRKAWQRAMSVVVSIFIRNIFPEFADRWSSTDGPAPPAPVRPPDAYRPRPARIRPPGSDP